MTLPLKTLYPPFIGVGGLREEKPVVPRIEKYRGKGQRPSKWFKADLKGRSQQMTKRTAAKYKIDRRMGENIWGRPKSPVNRREYGQGNTDKEEKLSSQIWATIARKTKIKRLLRRLD